MSNSRNWKAIAIPSLDGRKTDLEISGEVQSGIVPPKLSCRDTGQKLPENVFAVNVSGIAGGGFVRVTYTEDITDYKQYNIVLVFNEGNEIEAAILIDTANS